MAERQGGPSLNTLRTQVTSHRYTCLRLLQVGAGPHLDPGFADPLRQLVQLKKPCASGAKQQPALVTVIVRPQFGFRQLDESTQYL